MMPFAVTLGTIGALCAYLNLPTGASTATISSTTNLLRAVRQGTVTATARQLHDGADRLVAQVSQAQAVLGS